MKPLEIADLFCGAGGTSTGAIEAAKLLGFAPRLTAVNHWPTAVATHSANHPETRHFCASIDSLNPRELYSGRKLDLLWASPECTHHSNARGGVPMSDQSRASAHCVTRWAEALQPDIVLVENVREFQDWGPLNGHGRPIKSRKGETFKAWVGMLRSLGYTVEHRILCAADYGDPTTRHRLFVQAVRGRRRPVWPDPTHHDARKADLLSSKRRWRAAREIIDWDLPSTSIYERRRPLAPNTMKRIFAGLEKFGLRPFVAAWDHQSSTGIWSADAPLSTVTTKARHGVVEPFLVQVAHGGGTSRRARSIDSPIPTLCGSNDFGLAEPFLIEFRGTDEGHLRGSARSVDEPVPVVTAGGVHAGLVEPCLLPQHSGGQLRPVSQPAPTVTATGAIGLVEPFIVEYYGTAKARSVDVPLATATAKARFGLAQPSVEVDGKRYVLDIRFRMLQPHELAAAMGFSKGYQFTGTKTEVVKQIGNAVPRGLARALVAAALSNNQDVSWLS
ncbi:MAG: DNA cytosine methyltransferase [Verrucomicrobiales bacterium]|nr:DNA cytosine methyltransferase [Verrucomicrobiales bacterium]